MAQVVRRVPVSGCIEEGHGSSSNTTWMRRIKDDDRDRTPNFEDRKIASGGSGTGPLERHALETA
jgi:hypothetical protein